jgi:hypothetical protein
VAAGATLDDQGALLVDSNATLDVEGEVSVEGSLDDLGSVTVAAGGTLLAYNGTVTVESGVTLTVESSGTLDDSGTITVKSNGTLDGQGTVRVGSGSTLDVAGKVVIGSDGLLDTSGAVQVEDGASLNDEGVVRLETGGPAGSLDDQGMVMVGSGAALDDRGVITVGSGATLDSDGKVTVDTFGSLDDQGGITVGKGGSLDDQGPITIGKDATLDDQGTVTVEFLVTLTDLGTITVEAGATLDEEGTFTVGTTTTFDATGKPVAQDGTLDDAGAVTVGSFATLDVQGTLSVDSGALLSDQGILTVESKANLDVDGAVVVLPSAELDASGTVTVGTGGLIEVFGQFNVKPAGSLDVSGTVEIRAGGHLSEQGAVTVETAGVLSDQDAISVAAGATLDVSGTLREGAGGSLDVFGVLTIHLGGTLDDFTTITIEAGGTISVEATGSLDIFGTVNVEPGASFSLLGKITVEPGGLLKLPPSFSGLSAPVIVYGTASTTVSGHLGAGVGWPVPAGEIVQVTLDGVSQFTTLNSSGDFSSTFDTHALPVSGSPYSISLHYAGDTIFSPTDGSTSLTVNKALTASTLTPSAVTPLAGVDPVVLTAAITVRAPGSGTPTGSMDFYDTTTGKDLGSAPLVNGVASLNVGTFTAGGHALTATYSGDGNFVSSGGTASLTALVPASLSGTVFADFNDDGQIDFGEAGINGVSVRLTGTDDLGHSVDRSLQTDGDGAYVFLKLRPGNYDVTKTTQPSGYTPGIDSVGTAGGSLSGTDQFFVQLAQGVNGLNYNYGERPAATGPVQKGQTAGIGFWNNKKGQALILALNGGGSSHQLGDWLAATFRNLYGASSGNNLAGKSNAYVAALFQQDFLQKGPKLDAQVLATALAVYVTNATLDPTKVAAQYGFTVQGDGVGTATVNVGSSGDAFGVANNTTMTVMDLLLATDAQAVAGVLYNGNSTRRTEANAVYSALNQSGGIS